MTLPVDSPTGALGGWLSASERFAKTLPSTGDRFRLKHCESQEWEGGISCHGCEARLLLTNPGNPAQRTTFLIGSRRKRVEGLSIQSSLCPEEAPILALRSGAYAAPKKLA